VCSSDLLATYTKKGEYKYTARDEFKLVSSKGDKCYYKATFVPEKAGSFYYGIRIYPKHEDLPHRQDFYLLRWVD
jgi:starch phosphorylase